MAEVIDKANVVWRDFEEAGNPVSGARDPDKKEIREFAGIVDGKLVDHDAHLATLDAATGDPEAIAEILTGLTTKATKGVEVASGALLGIRGADIASASTVNLAVATGDYVVITGTTTINAFGTVADGLPRTLQFAGALTLTHNATSLILPTGGNVTTEAGDVFTFRSLGSGNWRCVSYQLASGKALAGIVATTPQVVAGLLTDRGSPPEGVRAALVDYTQDFKTDAYSATFAKAKALALGRNDPKLLTDFEQNATVQDWVNRVFRVGADSRAAAARFSQWSTVRATALAFALTLSGAYSSFAANALRETDKGILCESAATNTIVEPVVFSSASWAKTTSGATLVSGGGPSAICDAYDLTSSTTATGTSNTVGSSPTGRIAGAYTASVHMKRGDIRYNMLQISGAGFGSAVAFTLDWDAAGSPTLVASTGAVNSNATASIVPLASGWVRAAITFTTNATGTNKLTIAGAGGTAYTDRTYAHTSGQVIARVAAAQIEAGSIATSPILTGGGARADDAVNFASTGSADDIIVVEYVGGSASFLRSSLGSPTTISLLTDGGGAWLGKTITAFSILPALDTSYRPARQLSADRTSALIAAALGPLDRRMRQLTSATALTPYTPIYASDLTTPAQTEEGLPIFMMIDPVTGIYMLDGQIYGTEAAMVAAGGGTGSMAALPLQFIHAWEDTTSLVNEDFSSDLGGFTNNSAHGVSAAVGGELQLTASGDLAYFSRSMVQQPGRAYRFQMTGRKGTTTAGSVQALFSIQNSNFGQNNGSSNITTTTATTVSVYGSQTSGIFWIGGGQPGGGSGTSLWDNPKLFEVRPMRGFPQANFTLPISGVLPSVLPGTAQVIWQGDNENEKDRIRLELQPSGQIHLRVSVNNSTTQDITLGTLAGGDAFSIRIGLSRSVIRAALNNAGSEVDAIGVPGISSFRLGRSFTGEAFGGSITSVSIYRGVEGLGAMIRATAAAPVDTSKVWIDSDSYGLFGSTGIAMALCDAGYDVVSTGVSGDTFANEMARLTSGTNLAKYGERTVLIYDGSPNGHTDGQSAIETGLIDSFVTALGHNRWIYIRSGQIPGTGLTTSRSQSSLDMDAVYNYVKARYGPEHVWDPLPVVATFAITLSTDSGYAKDQAALTWGYFQPSALFDDVHLRAAIRRSLVMGRTFGGVTYRGLRDQIEVVRRL